MNQNQHSFNKHTFFVLLGFIILAALAASASSFDRISKENGSELGALPAVPNMDILPKECDLNSVSSLTPAASYFAEQLRQGTAEKAGGSPKEGFEPAMFMEAYPGLVPEDFNCVEAMQGVYTTKMNEGARSVVFTATENENGLSTAAESVTSTGMGKLLENIARRHALPLATEKDIDAILSVISTERGQLSPMPVEGEAAN